MLSLAPILIAISVQILPVLAFGTMGINCQGSGLCPRASWNNQNSASVVQVLRDVVWASTKSNSTSYPSGAHIICLSQSQPITVTVGPAIGGVSVGGTISGSGSIAEGGICLFAQGTSLTLGKIRPLVDAILEHKCTTCGSVPIHYVDEGSNDPSDGILTFNYVASPTCENNCISDTGMLPSSSPQSRPEPSAQPNSPPKSQTESQRPSPSVLTVVKSQTVSDIPSGIHYIIAFDFQQHMLIYSDRYS